MNVRLLILPFFCLVFTGCASMFGHGGEVPIIAPSSAHFEWADGSPLTLTTKEDGTLVADLSRTGCDTLILEDDGFVRRYKLEKLFNFVSVLNLLNWWLGALIDDATHSEIDYKPIYFLKPAGSRADTLDVMPTSDPFFDNPLRPRLVFESGLGFSSVPFDQVPLLPVHYQLKFGLNFPHRFELFYAGDADFLSDPFAHPDSLLSEGTTSNSLSILARYFPYGGVFVEAGYGWIKYTDDNNYSEFPNPPGGNYTTSSNTISGGLGWAGEISYFEVRYVKALHPLQLHDFPPVNFHNVIWSWGLRFRI